LGCKLLTHLCAAAIPCGTSKMLQQRRLVVGCQALVGTILSGGKDTPLAFKTLLRGCMMHSLEY
jgi:hypothetical protein